MKYLEKHGIFLPEDRELPSKNNLRFMLMKEWDRLTPSMREYILPQVAGGSDGLFYWDTREPHISSDIPAVTLAVTAKALYPAANFPILGGQYFARPGKKLKIRLFGRMTTVLTPGNGSFNVLYGTGADANGVVLMTGAPVALSPSQVNVSWTVDVFVHCRSIGATGTLFCTGQGTFFNGVIASTLQPIMLPANTPLVSGACDLTAALIISVQYLRSGSTVETMQVHDMEIVSLN